MSPRDHIPYIQSILRFYCGDKAIKMIQDGTGLDVGTIVTLVHLEYLRQTDNLVACRRAAKRIDKRHIEGQSRDYIRGELNNIISTVDDAVDGEYWAKLS